MADHPSDHKPSISEALAKSRARKKKPVPKAPVLLDDESEDTSTRRKDLDRAIEGQTTNSNNK